MRKTNIIFQPAPGNNEGPHDIKTYGTTLDIVEHFPYLGSRLSQKATIEAEIQHRNILYHHILRGLRNRVTHNLMEETKVMFYKAVCTITLQERGVGYISMSSVKTIKTFHQSCLRKMNSNPWDGNAPSLGNSWEPRKSKMAAVILVNYKNI